VRTVVKGSQVGQMVQQKQEHVREAHLGDDMQRRPTRVVGDVDRHASLNEHLHHPALVVLDGVVQGRLSVCAGAKEVYEPWSTEKKKEYPRP